VLCRRIIMLNPAWLRDNTPSQCYLKDERNRMIHFLYLLCRCSMIFRNIRELSAIFPEFYTICQWCWDRLRIQLIPHLWLFHRYLVLFGSIRGLNDIFPEFDTLCQCCWECLPSNLIIFLRISRIYSMLFDNIQELN
jgi:hypothetical protein